MSFAGDTAVTQIGPGRFTAELHERWSSLVGIHGDPPGRHGSDRASASQDDRPRRRPDGPVVGGRRCGAISAWRREWRGYGVAAAGAASSQMGVTSAESHSSSTIHRHMRRMGSMAS